MYVTMCVCDDLDDRIYLSKDTSFSQKPLDYGYWLIYCVFVKTNLFGVEIKILCYYFRFIVINIFNKLI